MSDTEIADKVRKTGTQIVLMYIAAPLTILAITYIFSTAVSNKEGIALISNGMKNVVDAVEKNTIAVKAMDKDNVNGHIAIASMVHGVQLAVGESTVRIDSLVDDLEKSVAHMEKHEEMIPVFEAWKSKVNIHIDDCMATLKSCEFKIEVLEHKGIKNGGN